MFVDLLRYFVQIRIYFVPRNLKILVNTELLISCNRKFAYGIESKTLDNEEFELQFVSYKKLPLTLKKIDSDQKYHVFVNVNQKRIQVEKIFVRIEGGSFWLPNIKYAEVTGIETSSNKTITERMLLK